MMFYLITILILDCIYPCVLRKKRHCLEKDILKGRVHPDTFIEIEEFIESTEVKNPGSTVTQPLEQHESNYFLGRPLYYYPTNKNNTSQRVDIDKSDIAHVIINPENIASGNLDISNVENVVTDKNSITDQIDNSFNDIKNYIESVLTEKQFSHYLLRLENLKTIYTLIMDNEEKFKKSDLIFEPFDTKLIAILDKLLLNFDINAEFNQKDFEKFKKELHDAIFSDKDLRLLNGKIRIQSNDDMKLLFYAEVNKCMNNVCLIPELLLLGGTFLGRSIDFIIVLIHSINLLMQKRKDSPLLKNFVRFLIKRAFESTKHTSFDLFSINKLITDCPENHHDLYFFIWEMNSAKRKDLKFKCLKNEIFHFTSIDKLHFRTVLLIFIYQQIILLKCNNAGDEELKRYIDLIKRVINDDKCPDCDFDKFFKLLQNSA